MALHYEDGQIQLHHGDCREVLASLPDCSVDSVVTDPPYELGFMGKTWDGSGIAYSVEMWAEVLRVLKPGGHLCAFGGTRTYHRMACAIEDAGFEIRDSLHWVYGSGFPKSLDVSKAIDKQRHDRADILKVADWLKPLVYAVGVHNVADAFGVSSTMVSQHWCSHSQTTVPTLEQVPLLLDTLGVEFDDVPEDIRRLLWDLNGRKGQPGENWWKREVVGKREVPVGHSFAGPTYGGDNSSQEVSVTTAATDAAKQWEGWGTALKPAHEPIVLARKPLIGTVAANVLTHGTGALNIDGTRVPGIAAKPFGTPKKSKGGLLNASDEPREQYAAPPGGRWPANVIFDTEAGALLDEQADGASRFFTAIDWDDNTDIGIDVPFRYVPKPSKRERTCEGTVSGSHPTVKPLALMRWLVRLVTPPGGTVLEPFAGSGTTLMACVMEGFNGIGIEMTDEYLPIIEGRVKWAHDNQPTQEQLPL